jgi:phenylalanyl-tRNA synthetase alpha chain
MTPITDTPITDPDLQEAHGSALTAFAAATDLDELGAARATHLGKKSALAAVQRRFGQLSPDERKVLGAQVNAVKSEMIDAEAARRSELEAQRDERILASERVDVTLPARRPPRGGLHPLHETMDAMLDVLVGMGYTVLTGPEVETDWHNFDALNTPVDHPARTLQDTIYVGEMEAGDHDVSATTGTLLRTQTSPMQVRAMLDHGAPLFVAVPGRVYRQDTADATHLPVFHQIEGLAVAEGVSMADLKGTLQAFARALLGPDIVTRLRPHFFPFTEPSAELDVQFEGRWMELLWSGMVHPNVLRAGGLDPEEVSGFAFGMGVDRMAMLRHGVTDLRLFIDNDPRFLSSFVTA